MVTYDILARDTVRFLIPAFLSPNAGISTDESYKTHSHTTNYKQARVTDPSDPRGVGHKFSLHVVLRSLIVSVCNMLYIRVETQLPGARIFT